MSGAREAGRAQELFETVEGPGRRVLGGGEALVQGELTAPGVVQDEVREGAPDVDSHAISIADDAHCRPPQ